MYRNNGIIGKGLRGGPTGAILGRFTLGPALEIEIVSGGPDRPNRGGPGGGVSGGSAHWPGNVKPYDDDTDDAVIYDEIRITMHRNNVKWTKTIKVQRTKTPIIVNVVSIINRITTNVSAHIVSFRALLAKIRIKK